MKIVIDLQGAQSASRFRGIGRYTMALTREMIRQGHQHEFIIVLNGAFTDTLEPLRKEFSRFLPKKNIRVWMPPQDAWSRESKSEKRLKQAEIIYETFLTSLAPDIVLVTTFFEIGNGIIASLENKNQKIPRAVIVYDFIPLHNPDYYFKDNLTKRLYEGRLASLKEAKIILAISNHTASDVSIYLPSYDRDVVNISAACFYIFDIETKNEEKIQKIKEFFSIKKEFVITSGNVEPHKNLQKLFEAFAILPTNIRNDYQLVLVGATNDNQRKMYKNWAHVAGLDPKSLVVTGYVSDAELLSLYSHARLMVFPSVDEGFGLPPLEAMSCGTPAIAANRASLPEVIGLDAALFDPFDVTSMSQLMQRVIEDDDFHALLVGHSRIQAKKFSWARSAQLALAAIEKLGNAGEKLYHADNALDDCLSALGVTNPTEADINHLAPILALNFPEQKRAKRLFVDVSVLAVHDARTGCQRVTRSVIYEWLMNPPDGVEVSPVYAKSGVTCFYHARSFTAKFLDKNLEEPDLPIDFAPGDIFFGLDLNAGMYDAHAAALVTMRNYGVFVMFYVYDLLPLEMPRFFVDGTKAAFEKWIKIITRFDGIIAISQASADAVLHWQKTNNSGDVVEDFSYDAVHLGADIENSLPTKGLPNDAEQMLSMMEKRICFLMTGTLEPRKGHEHALDAFDVLWQQGHDTTLVIVGKRGWYIDTFLDRLTRHPELGKRLFWLEGISDEYLDQIYRRAGCLLAASWGEGFGLPLIEAARYKVPILARNLPVFREVAGQYATYFDCETAGGLSAALTDWLKAYSEGKVQTSDGMPVSTWAESAKKIMDIILERAKI